MVSRLRCLCCLVAVACSTEPKSAHPATTAGTLPDAESDSGGLPEGVEAPLYSGEWTRPRYDVLDDLPLPAADDGRGYVWIETSQMSLRLDPTLRDPVTAAGACVSVVIACHEPNVRNYHGCLAQGPTCATDQPWEESELCCPSACVEHYVGHRAAGLNEPDAVLEAIFGDDPCIPSLASARAGGAE